MDFRIDSTFVVVPARQRCVKDQMIRESFHRQHSRVIDHLKEQKLNFINLRTRFNELDKHLSLHYSIDEH